MRAMSMTVLPCALLLALVPPAEAQTMKLGEVLVVSTPTPGADPGAFEAFVTGEAAPAWRAAAPGLSLHLLRADRGARNGEYLALWIAGTRADRDATLADDDAAPFSKDVLDRVGDTSAYLDAGSCTDYQLIGAERLGELPSVDILGIHPYEVKPGQGAAFEAFVRDTLHPALASAIPGMSLLYFKGVRGVREGSYVLVFAIATLADRERYWPTGQPETDAVRAAFAPMSAIGRDLRSYLVDGSYLAAEGAAAPVFESLRWTDFVNVRAGLQAARARRGTAGKPIPVILDTDIGGDIDDTWALVMLLKSPELDCKLLTTCTGDTTYRAKVAAKLLELAGRTDIPIGIGPAGKGGTRPQADWVTDYDLSSYPGTVHADGARALVDAVMSASEPLTIVAIGPLTTVAEALRREPGIASRSRIVAMAGNIRRPFGDATGAIPEYNVKIDVPASKAVFAAPWDMTITPLDTCGFVRIEGEAYRRVRDAEDSLVRALMDNYRIWCRALGRDDWWPERSSILFDTVAVRLAFSEEHLVMEDLRLTVEDDGLTAVTPDGRPVRTATEWADQDAYEAFLVDRLVHGTH